MHHKTFRRVRAATPAVKSAAAAPSIAPWPPPATSCSAPSAKPPSGRRPSIDAKGQNQSPACGRALEALDARAKLLDTGTGDGRIHVRGNTLG